VREAAEVAEDSLFGLLYEHHLQTRIMEMWLTAGVSIYTSKGFPPGKSYEKICFSKQNSKLTTEEVNINSLSKLRTYYGQETETVTRLPDVVGSFMDHSIVLELKTYDQHGVD